MCLGEIINLDSFFFFLFEFLGYLTSKAIRVGDEIYRNNIIISYDFESPCIGFKYGIVFEYLLLFALTHCRLNRLSHTIYWKSQISILGMSSYEIRYS